MAAVKQIYILSYIRVKQWYVIRRFAEFKIAYVPVHSYSIFFTRAVLSVIAIGKKLCSNEMLGHETKEVTARVQNKAHLSLHSPNSSQSNEYTPVR